MNKTLRALFGIFLEPSKKIYQPLLRDKCSVNDTNLKGLWGF